MRNKRSVEKKNNILVKELQACSMNELKRIAFIKGIHVSSKMRKKKKAMIHGIEEFVMCNQAKPQTKSVPKSAKTARKEMKKATKTRAKPKSTCIQPLQRRSNPNGRITDAKSTKKKTKKEQKVNRSSRKTTVRSRRSRNPGEIKQEKQIVNRCLLKPSFDETTGLETKCPDFMTYDANSNCCKFSNEWMNKLRNEIDYDLNMMQLNNLVDDSSVSDNEKKILKKYLREQGQNFERNVTGVIAERFSSTASDRSTMNWVLDALKGFYKYIKDNLYFVMSSFQYIYKMISKFYRKVTKTLGIDYTQEVLGERNANAVIGMLLGGLGGLGIAYASGGLSLAAGAFTTAAGLWAGGGALAGSLLGYYGIGSLLSGLMNSSFVQRAKNVLMAQLMSPVGITMVLDFFLETKRTICARIGVLYKNRVLWMEYCAKNNYNIVKQLAEDMKQNVKKSVDTYMITSLAKDVTGMTSKYMVKGLKIAGESMIDAANMSAEPGKKIAKKAVEKVSLGVVKDVDLTADVEKQKKALGPIMDCIEFALNHAIGGTFIGIDLNETWEKIKDLLSYEDCFASYRRERIRLLHQNMLREVDRVLNEAVEEGLAELYLGGKKQNVKGKIDVRKLLTNHVDSQPTTLTLTQQITGALKRNIRKTYEKEIREARKIYRTYKVGKSLSKGDILTAGQETFNAYFNDPDAQYRTVGDYYKPVEGQLVESSAEVVKNGAIATNLVAMAHAGVNVAYQGLAGMGVVAKGGAILGGAALTVKLFVASAFLMVASAGLYYLYQGIVVRSFKDYKTKSLRTMRDENLKDIRPKINEILKMDVDKISSLMLEEANKKQLQNTGSVAASKTPAFNVRYTDKKGANTFKKNFEDLLADEFVYNLTDHPIRTAIIGSIVTYFVYLQLQADGIKSIDNATSAMVDVMLRTQAPVRPVLKGSGSTENTTKEEEIKYVLPDELEKYEHYTQIYEPLSEAQLRRFKKKTYEPCFEYDDEDNGDKTMVYLYKTREIMTKEKAMDLGRVFDDRY
eukprot:jgi/Bigna1/70730/fgenesh1_pg.13_\